MPYILLLELDVLVMMKLIFDAILHMMPRHLIFLADIISTCCEVFLCTVLGAFLWYVASFDLVYHFIHGPKIF